MGELKATIYSEMEHLMECFASIGLEDQGHVQKVAMAVESATQWRL